MIDQLVRYAQCEGIVLPPGFTPKVVKWAVDVGAGHSTLLLLGDPSLKNNPGQAFPCCPDLSQPELKALKGIGAHFLVATCDQVALYPEPDPESPEGRKTLQKHAFFVGLLRQASAAVPELAAAAEVLEDPALLDGLRRALAEQKAKPTDRITVRIDQRFPLEGNGWHAWWREFRASIAAGRSGRRSDTAPPTESGGDGPMVCLATGEPVEPVPTHPKIAGLADVGGLAMGTVLIGYDKEAFASYGLKQSANGAMSAETAAAYREGLNHLLAHHSRKLAGARVAHWYHARVAQENDALSWLDDPPQDEREEGALRRQEQSAAQQRAAELLGALRTGKVPNLLGNRYYALTLSGSGGRVMVRDWMEGPFEELVANIGKWFGDFAIVRRDGAGLAPPPKLLAILASTARDLNDVPAPHAAQLWKAAVAGLPIPRQLMALSLARVKVALVRDDPVAHAGMGILKAYHTRIGKGGTMSPYLNEEHPEPAYHCGRLMALLARVQFAALGDVGAGVVQRYYAAASATPALVLGRLTRTSQFHLNKLRVREAEEWEGRIADVWGRICDRVPAVLTLEQQSLFALGYYQQIAAERAPRNGADQKEVSNG